MNSTTKFVLLLAVFLLPLHNVNAQQLMSHDNNGPEITSFRIGMYSTGLYDEGAAEISAYDPGSMHLFFTNAEENTIEVLDISDPSNPTQFTAIDMSVYGDGVNSVAVHDGLVAVAVEAADVGVRGSVEFFNAADATHLKTVEGGFLPDAVTFTPNGDYLIVSNEGEPNDGYTIDPVGSVSIIKISDYSVAEATFDSFNAQKEALIASGVWITGPGASVAQDLEPEYATSPDGVTAYVVLQENNALAVVDIASATVTSILPLGTKDHSLFINGLDASNKDKRINIREWPVKGLYMPDAIASATIGGKNYLFTANEGDSREYEDGDFLYVDEARVKDLKLDSTIFTEPDLQSSEKLGRIKVKTALPDTNAAGEYKTLYTFGARSFSIWDTEGNLVFDSGNDFERITAERYPNDFNSTNSDNDSFDNRSDDKGPEPEAVTVIHLAGETYALVGLERMGGVMVYNVSDPANAKFVEYFNDRNYSELDFQEDFIKDTLRTDSEIASILKNTVASGPESITFIPQGASPLAEPLAVVSNEVTGTVTINQINFKSKAAPLFFSEYAEGSSNNKYLEIYNPTSDTVSLSGYALANATNGANVPGTYDFWNQVFSASHKIAPSGVFVVAHPSADPIILAEADTTHQYLSNGDDGYALVYGTEDNFEILDMLGDWFADPGSGWDVGDVTNGTKDHTLVRKLNIQRGNAGPRASFGGAAYTEWIVKDKDDWSGLGQHAQNTIITILHNNDGESQLIDAGEGLEEFGGVARFASAVEKARFDARQKGNLPILLSSGDNFLAGPEFNASLTLGTFFDAKAIGLLEYEALALGNHEFDAGPVVLSEFINSTDGNDPAFLSANLDFTNVPSLSALESQGRIAASVVYEEETGRKRKLGIIGATTENLPFISSPGETIVKSVLPSVQAEVDALKADGVNHIILISHLQGIEEDSLLATKLSDVDVVIAGGGDDLLANSGALLVPGDEIRSAYPMVVADADGNDIPLVTVKGQYTYLGRLDVEFDTNGDVVSFNGNPIRIASVTQEGGFPDHPEMMNSVVLPVKAYVDDLDKIEIASSTVPLQADREQIRSRETNMGNLVTDAYIALALDGAEDFGLDINEDRLVALANGGGIRATIPPGSITAKQTFDVLPFPNNVAYMPDVAPEMLHEVMENAVSRIDPSTGIATGGGTGRFAQISGFRVEFDPNNTAIVYNDDDAQTISVRGTRVRTITLNDGTPIVEDGEVVSGAPSVDLLTADYTAGGGDQYPFRGQPFSTIGLTYQQALQIYLEEYVGEVNAINYPVRGEGRIVNLAMDLKQGFTLTVLHNNDGESQLINAGGSLQDFGGVARFASVVHRERHDAMKQGFDPILLSAGDNFLPSPEFDASLESGTFYDAKAINLLRYDAVAIGNHDFDMGPVVLAEFIEQANEDNPFTEPRLIPFLSANLDYTGSPELSRLIEKNMVASSSIVFTGQNTIGVIGATTENLPFISSPGAVTVKDVAESVSAEVAKLEAAGVDAIILVSHLQGIQEDSLLATQSKGIDIYIAGGGDDLLANTDDLLLPGDVAKSPYPMVVTDMDGIEVPIVSTKGEYGYLGRLDVTFDELGNVISFDGGQKRVASEFYPDGVTEDPLFLEEIVDPVAEFVQDLATSQVGVSEVFLFGSKDDIRSRETNLGNLIADGFRATAIERGAGFGLELDPNRTVAVTNGGGIRASIAAGKITAQDVSNVLPFSNNIAVFQDLGPEVLQEIMENAVSRIDPETGQRSGGGTGRFAQISGFKVEFDPSKTAIEYNSDDEQSISVAGSRVLSITLNDGTEIVKNGFVVDGAPSVNIITNDYIAKGGDQYPYRGASFETIGLTYTQALGFYITENLGGVVFASQYPVGGEGRIVDVLNTFENQKPVVNLPVEMSMLEDQPMTFDANKVMKDDRALDANHMSMTFKGSFSMDDDINGTMVTLNPDTNAYGQLKMILTVTDDHGETASDSTIITVIPVNDAPTATFDFEQGGNDDGNNVVTFTSTSNDDADPNGFLVSYFWNFGDGTTSTEANPTKEYTFSQEFEVELTVTDNQGATSTTKSPVNVTVVTSSELENLPTEFTLNQNYPNPFNPTTVINYDIPEATNVVLTVYNMLGQKMTTLVNENKSAGRYSINFDATLFSSGVYIYRLEAGQFVSTKKMMLIK